MLKIELDMGKIADIVECLAKSEEYADWDLARSIFKLSQSFKKAAGKFNKRQLLVDGKRGTIQKNVLTLPRSKVPAAILKGIHLPVKPLLSNVECRPGGSPMNFLDGETYLTQLDDGPPAERSYRTLTSLVIYFASLNRMKIIWIGPEKDCADVTKQITEQCQTIAGLENIDQNYASVLGIACKTSTILM
ncbi:MAG: hypothetical protein JKY25_00695 [Robiginitomaculum sp.]|nr:hypothetical protein [Robiginitomaculum sp.]